MSKKKKPKVTKTMQNTLTPTNKERKKMGRPPLLDPRIHSFRLTNKEVAALQKSRAKEKRK